MQDVWLALASPAVWPVNSSEMSIKVAQKSGHTGLQLKSIFEKLPLFEIS